MKLSSSSKASEKALGMVFGVITFLLILAIVVFVFIPKITKPLGVDPCLQQGGVRALSCDDAVAMRNNFIEPDKQNNICCMALPGQQAEFKTWASALSDTQKESTTQSVVRIDDLRNLNYNLLNGIGIFLHDAERPALAPSLSTQNIINIIPQLSLVQLNNPNNIIKPGDTRVVAGVNKFGNGRCILAIYQADIVQANPPYYKPKETQEGVAQHVVQGYYDNKDCKNETAVQLTFKLQGLPEPHPFYIVAYSVETTRGTMTSYALLNVSLGSTTSGGTPGGTPGDSTTGQGGTTQTCDSSKGPDCSTLKPASQCLYYKKNFETSNSCGCEWVKTGWTKEECRTCLVGSCSGYTTYESCISDPCVVKTGTCLWMDKTCVDCASVKDCGGYTDESSCEDNACRLTGLNCEWKTPFFDKNYCQSIQQDTSTNPPADESNPSEGDPMINTINELEGTT